MSIVMVSAERVINFYRNLPQLEADRIILRKMLVEDAPGIFLYASDPEVVKYLRWGPHQSISETENYVNEVMIEYQDGQDGPWMVVLKRSGRVIGHIHLMEMDANQNKAQIGFVLSRKYWNQGIMTEALKEVLAYYPGVK